MSARISGRHAVVALAGQWSKYAVQIVALVTFSRLLNPHDIGVVAMVLAVVGVAHVLGDFGLSLAALRAQDLSPGQRTNLFWITSAIGLLIMLGVCAVAPLLAHVYDEPQVVAVTYAVSVVFLLNGVSGQLRTELNLAQRFSALAAADVLSQVAGLAAGVVAVLLGTGYWGLVVQQVCAAAVLLGMLASQARWWPGLPRRGQRMGGLLRFGSLTLAAQLVNYASSNADAILVGRVWGTAALGIYNRAYQVARLPVQQVAAPLTRVVLPQLAMRLSDPPAFASAVRRAQLVLTTLLLGALGLIAGAAEPLVDVVLGPGWDQAVPYLRVLCLGSAFQAAGYIYYWVLLAHDRSGVLLASEIGARVVMVTLMVLAVPHGVLWVALAAATGQLLLLVSGAVIALPRVGMPARSLLAVSLRPALLFATAAAATALVDARWGTELPSPVALVLALAVFAGCSAAGLLFGGYRRDARELVSYSQSVLSRSVT